MERVLFIFPPNISYSDFAEPDGTWKIKVTASGTTLGQLITEPPLGILALSAYVKKGLDTQTKLLDFNVDLNKVDEWKYGSFSDYFFDRLTEYADFNPTIICISSLFAPSYVNFIDIADICAKLFPDAFLVAGGHIPTTCYREIFRDTKAFRAICYGEGEIPLRELVTADDKMAAIERSVAWITPEKVAAGFPFEQVFIQDLDEIPNDYALIDIDDYHLNPTIDCYIKSGQRGRAVNMMTSRGCPFRCVFCASHRTHGRSMRYHSLERVKQDILYFKENHGVNTITFLDDHFMSDRQRAYDIVCFLAEQGITGFFPNALAIYALDSKMIEALSRAGVDQLILAVESGSEKILRDVMHKPLKLEFVRRATNDCRRFGIYTDCNVMIGLPGETKADMADGLAFLKTVDANWFRINIATPLIGSELHDICVDKGYLKSPPLVGSYKNAIIETEDFTSDYVQKQAYAMNIELNFVNNADMRLGRYDLAIRAFDVVLKVKPDHAIAHYYLAICHDRIGDPKTRDHHMSKAAEYAVDPFWQPYFAKFGLTLGNEAYGREGQLADRAAVAS